MSAELENSIISVLYIEDDVRLSALTTTYLRSHGLTINPVSSGESALESLNDHVPDVVLLDLMLPGKNGHELCKIIRKKHDIPIIMVTALDEEAERVLGLEEGADDYVVKPFSSRELLARIRAQVRRARGKLQRKSVQLNIGPLTLDETTYRVTLHDEEIVMTSYEFSLLRTLMSSPGRVFSREQLIMHTRDHGDEIFERAIDVQISRLRQKLGDDPKKPFWIKTVRGVGYMIVAKA